MNATTLEKEPRLYRDNLRQVKTDLEFNRSFDVRNRLLNLGFSDIAELEKAAANEESKARPASLTAAEKARALAQSALEQSEAQVAQEKAKFAAIEGHRIELHRAREYAARIPTPESLKAQIDALEDVLAQELFADCNPVAEHYRSARIANAIAQLNRLDGELRVNRQVVSIGQQKIADAQAALAALEKKR